MRIVAGLVAAASTLAACGSSGSASGDAAPEECAPGVTDSEVTMGAIYSDSGVMEDQFSSFRAGLAARIGVENKAGGVDGRQIVVDWEDDQSTTSGNSRAAKDLVRRDVFGILEYTIFSEGSADWLAERGVPAVGVADGPRWGQHDNMFTFAFVTHGTKSSTTLGDFIRSNGGTKVAFLTTYRTESSAAYAAGVKQSLAAAGIEVVFDTEIDGLSTEKVGAEVLRSQADAVISAVSPDLYARVLATLSAAGRSPVVAITPIGYDERLLAMYGPALAGTYSQLTFTALERNLPVHQRYRDAMATYAPEIQPTGQQAAVMGWIGADLFIRGLQTQQGACPTRQSYMDGLRGVSDYDGDGLLVQPIDLTADRGQVDRCADFVRISADGTAFEVVAPEPVCGERLETPQAPAQGDQGSTAQTAGGQGFPNTP